MSNKKIDGIDVNDYIILDEKAFLFDFENSIKNITKSIGLMEHIKINNNLMIIEESSKNLFELK